MPVMISRSGRCPWRTSRWRPSAVSLSAWQLSKAATSASTACASSAQAPLRKTSVSESAKLPGWESWKTLVSVTAYHSFSGEVEASNTPTIRRLIPSCRHQLSSIAQRHSIELVERSLVEAFADAVGLRALSLGARMIDVLDREIELVLVPFGIAAELAAAVGEHAQQLGIALLEEWQYPVVQQVGRGDRRLAVIQLAESDLGIGVDEGLLVDPPDALEIADVERVLRATVAGMLALELTVGLLLDLRALQRHNLRLGEHQPLLGTLGLQRLEPLLHRL